MINNKNKNGKFFKLIQQLFNIFLFVSAHEVVRTHMHEYEKEWQYPQRNLYM